MNASDTRTLPANVGAVIDLVAPLRGEGAEADLELAQTLFAAGALIALTRIPAEHVSALFSANASAWMRRAREELGISPSKRDTAARIEAAVQTVLGILDAPQEAAA